MIYTSTTSGQTKRIIKPHSIFHAGGQWYLRSLSINYDISDFRTFRFSRVLSTIECDKSNTVHSKLDLLEDIDWNTFKVLSICPHPEHRESLYQMIWVSQEIPSKTIQSERLWFRTFLLIIM